MSPITTRGQDTSSGARRREISAAGYRQLAEFHHRIRQFLHITEEGARSKGIEPQHHQALLAIKGLPEGCPPTVGTLSEMLCLRHHSTVELIDRLEEQRAVARRHSNRDRREVLVELTPHGEGLLHQLSALHREELRVSGPSLAESLLTILVRSAGRGRRQHGSADPNQAA
jgi:DNA-binding MarR family transcriptional regulator